jgi:hypothetical protein
MKKLIIAFATFALAVGASAATKYNVTLYEPSVVNGTQLKPGDYKVEIAGDKVIFKQGKTAVEVAAKVEDATEKYNSNVVRYSEGGKMQEMRIGGTHTRLVFEGGGSTSAPAGDR